MPLITSDLNSSQTHIMLPKGTRYTGLKIFIMPQFRSSDHRQFSEVNKFFERDRQVLRANA